MNNNVLAATDIVSQIFSNYEEELNGEFRPHLGASMGGDPCLRKLYYNFRHATFITHKGRILRLFQRGHKEEFTFIDELNKVGIKMLTVDQNGKQFRLGTPRNKHVSGSGDGFGEVMQNSEYFIQGEWVIVEMKTHNDKSFSQLVKKGVAESKPLHLSQMNLYMKWAQMSKALYIAVNKNNDDLYVEAIRYDPAHAERVEDRMVDVAESTTIPVRMCDDPSRFECRFCDYHNICHDFKYPLNVTCRNCAHVKPVSDGTWRCDLKNQDNLPPSLIKFGCQQHIIHPDFLANIATISDSNVEENYIEFEFNNGFKMKNGTPRDGVYDSATVASVVTNGYEAFDENMLALLNDMDAKIIKAES